MSAPSSEAMAPADGMVVIKCLSLWEPWASLMAVGAKRNETRSWSTSYRGPLLICASKRVVMRELVALLHHEPGMVAALKQPGDKVLGDVVNRLCFGKAVALVDLVDVIPTERIVSFDGDEREFGDYTPGRFAWVTQNVRRINPFPITGHQGLWNEVVATSKLERSTT